MQHFLILMNCQKVNFSQPLMTSYLFAFAPYIYTIARYKDTRKLFLVFLIVFTASLSSLAQSVGIGTAMPNGLLMGFCRQSLISKFPANQK